jgi:hypothetical protein
MPQLLDLEVEVLKGTNCVAKSVSDALSIECTTNKTLETLEMAPIQEGRCANLGACKRASELFSYNFGEVARPRGVK